VHGGLEHTYLEACRTGATLLQTTQAPTEVRVDPEADQALEQLKEFLSKPPVLTTPRKKEQLLLYLAVTTHMVSTAIVIEQQEDGHTYPVQQPVYFVSEVLSKSMARYQLVQKLLYAVLITSRKLRHNF
jgi:dsDNA-binding SOS-regulon protein